MTALEVPVLIVGGGPVGFVLALDLARRGTRSMLIERDAGTGLEILAKAGTLNERTMEYSRWLGIRDAIVNVGFPDDYPRDTVYCTSLNGFVLGRDPMPSTLDREAPKQSPEMLRKCPQLLFDPLVADAVIQAGYTDVRYGTEFVSYTEDMDAVSVTLRQVESGHTATVRADYLVGCDGAGSMVRRAAGIGFDGTQLDYSVSAMLRIRNLADYHPLGRGERYMFVGTEGTWANLSAVDGRELYRLTMVGSPERLSPEQLDVPELVRRSMGRDDVPYEVVRVMPWRRSQYTADTFGRGRVLIAGDAAHTTSPTGGHGLNTGLGDTSDLSWMLDAVLRGLGWPLNCWTPTPANRRPVASLHNSIELDPQLCRLGAVWRARVRAGKLGTRRGAKACAGRADERHAEAGVAFPRRGPGLSLRPIAGDRPRRLAADPGRPVGIRADRAARTPRAARLAA